MPIPPQKTALVLKSKLTPNELDRVAAQIELAGQEFKRQR